MHRPRFSLLLALTLLLAACGTQAGGDNPSSSSGPDTSAPASDAGASGAASSGVGSGEPTPACAEAFAPLAELGLESTSDLGDLAEVEATVEACASLADWMAGADQVVEGDVRQGTAELLLGIRCADPSLSGTPICTEVN